MAAEACSAAYSVARELWQKRISAYVSTKSVDELKHWKLRAELGMYHCPKMGIFHDPCGGDFFIEEAGAPSEVPLDLADLLVIAERSKLLLPSTQLAEKLEGVSIESQVENLGTDTDGFEVLWLKSGKMTYRFADISTVVLNRNFRELPLFEAGSAEAVLTFDADRKVFRITATAGKVKVNGDKLEGTMAIPQGALLKLGKVMVSCTLAGRLGETVAPLKKSISASAPSAAVRAEPDLRFCKPDDPMKELMAEVDGPGMVSSEFQPSDELRDLILAAEKRVEELKKKEEAKIQLPPVTRAKRPAEDEPDRAAERRKLHPTDADDIRALEDMFTALEAEKEAKVAANDVAPGHDGSFGDKTATGTRGLGYKPP